MGDYISYYVSYNGQTVKIGTWASLYYTTYLDYRRVCENGLLEKVSGSLPPDRYLDGDFRFRFPFPDEFATLSAINGWDDFDRGWLIYAPLDWMAGLVDHDQVTMKAADYFGTSLSPHLPEVTMRVNCPQDGTERRGLRFDHAGYQYVEVVQQRPYDGNLWTVCRCPYCGTLWRVPPDNAVELEAHILTEYGDNPAVLELASIMMDGYLLPTYTPKEDS